MDILPLPLWSLVITLLVTIVATIAMVLWSFCTDYPWKRIFTIPGIIILLAGVISLISWLTIASNGREVDYTEDCEVKPVTFPDGKTAQMFFAAGSNHNANEMFGSMIPEDHVVRRWVYKRTYQGIYYTEYRKWLADQYTIAKKDSEGLIKCPHKP